MVEVFWDAPYYAHIIVAIVTLVIMGVMSVDKKGKFDRSNIAPTIISLFAMVFLWQIVVVIVIILGVSYIPFQLGVFIKKKYVSWNTAVKANEEAKNLISKNLNKSNSKKIVEVDKEKPSIENSKK